MFSPLGFFGFQFIRFDTHMGVQILQMALACYLAFQALVLEEFFS